MLFKRKFNYLNKFKQYSISRSSSKYTVLLLFLIVVQYSIIKAFTNNAVQSQNKLNHNIEQYSDVVKGHGLKAMYNTQALLIVPQ